MSHHFPSARWDFTSEEQRWSSLLFSFFFRVSPCVLGSICLSKGVKFHVPYRVLFAASTSLFGIMSDMSDLLPCILNLDRGASGAQLAWVVTSEDNGAKVHS